MLLSRRWLLVLLLAWGFVPCRAWPQIIYQPPARLVGVYTTATLPDGTETSTVVCAANRDLAVVTDADTPGGVLRICDATGTSYVSVFSGPSSTTGLVVNDTSILAMNRAVATVASNTDLGQHAVVNALPPAEGLSLLVPPAATSPVGEYSIIIGNSTNGPVTLLASGSDTLADQASPLTMRGLGSMFTVLRTSTTNWDVETRTALPTGAIDFSAAAAFRLPAQASPAPTAAGDCRFDTTKKAQVCGDGTSPIVQNGTVSIQFGGSTNTSTTGTNTQIVHTPAFTLPANFFTLGRKLLFCAHFLISTGSSDVPTMLIRFRLGGAGLGAAVALTPSVNLSNRGWSQCTQIVAAAAPSAASPMYSAPLSTPIAMTNGNQASNSFAMPQTYATNGPLVADITSIWDDVGVGTNTLTLLWISLEIAN